jgi:hypothetical protein
MKRIGNAESNRTYNPRNVKPRLPVDVDETDSAMERYIRKKYEQRVYMDDARNPTRHDTAEDRPPPLPPKPSKGFGFGLRKSATSPRDLTPPVSPGFGSFERDASPPRVNKPSRVFGSNIQTSGDGLDSKLATLRDMGFPDDRRNSTVLKGLNGNLDRTVEALIRLGEQNSGKSEGSTPNPPAKSNANGLTFDRTQTTPATSASNNPFDALDAIAGPPPSQQQQQQPQPAQLQTQQPYAGYPTQTTSSSNSCNPFLSHAQPVQYQEQQNIPQQQQQQQTYGYQQNAFGQQQGLEHSLQNMQLSNQEPQQPLFPNRTGGYGPIQPPFAQTNPFQQSFTPPPMPQIPEQYSSFFQPQPQYQSMSSPSSPGNPFLRSSRSQMFSPSNPTGSNPYGQQQQATNSSMMQQQHQTPTAQAANPWQTQQQTAPQNPYQQLSSQQNPYQQQSSQQNPYQQQSSQQNPYQQQSTPQSNYQQQQAQQQSFQQPSYQQNGFQQQQQQQQQQHQTGYQQYQSAGPQQNGNPFDKNSILALYNNPQQAPQRSEQQQASSVPAPAAVPSTSMSGHMNPFSSSHNGQPGQSLSAAQTPGVRHVSNESVDFAGLTGGRHSPDAFSGLSASFRR